MNIDIFITEENKIVFVCDIATERLLKAQEVTCFNTLIVCLEPSDDIHFIRKHADKAPKQCKFRRKNGLSFEEDMLRDESSA